jgi:transposase-like protein
MTDTPCTLIEAVRYFADLDVCHAYMAKIRWTDGKPVCPECSAKGDRIGAIATRHMLRCKDCRKQFSHKVGTIFEDSPLGLDKWFVAVWAIANCKNGVSSHELARALGVTQKTAWFMLHRIRKAMEVGGFDKLEGPAEADATYVGGKAKNMHKGRREAMIQGRGAVGKTIVHGILERGDGKRHSYVRADVVVADDAECLLPAVRRNVRYGQKVYTDAAPGYGDLALTHLHKAVDHSVAYAKGQIHTNGLENFWSLLKRSLKGTYVAVAPFHLRRYVAEQAFRFNTRKGKDAGRFNAAMCGTIGKRLTYRALTQQGDAGFMGIQ